jgi:hypothetical protein
MWKAQIINFIDENCLIFEDVEENRLEYTTVHKEFSELVEGKLEDFIQDLGIKH